MARPQKKAIDYFPLDCLLDDSVKFVEAKHDIIGFGVLVKLWSKIYSSEGYYCHWDEKTKYLFCKETGVSVEDIEAILTTCLTEGLFSKSLFDSHQILTSSGIQKRYFKIVKEAKRKEIEINPEIYLLEVNSGENSINSGGNPENSGNTPVENPQSKVKKSKVNKSKGKKVQQKPPDNSSDQAGIYQNCKEVFLKKAKGYYWEAKDDSQLKQLLTKLDSVVEQVLSEQELAENFTLLLRHLPKYWRTKKFTIYHINQNFNEIINEIQTHPNNGAIKGDSTKGKFGRHNVDELVKRALTFGR